MNPGNELQDKADKINTENLMLVLPSMVHRAAALDYVSEFIEKKDDINGMGIDSDVISNYDAYGNWISWLYGETASKTPESTMSDDYNFTYFYIDETDHKLIGTINLRTENELAKEFGNIGFAVRPSMRGQGYGSAMVEAAISLCGFYGLEELTAICRKDNNAAVNLLCGCGFCFAGETENGYLKYFLNRKGDKKWFGDENC